MTIQIREGMPLDEYIERIQSEQTFEILNGEIVRMSPTVAGHDDISLLLFLFLQPLAEQGLGRALMESAFVVRDTPDWVLGSRIPDVMFVLTETFKAYRENTPDYKDKPYIFVPELVIEVLSKGDSMVDVEAKVELYLQDGVLIVWVVDPFNEKVYIHTSGSDTIQVLNVKDTLTGGDVLPSLSIPLSKIFQ